MSYIGNTNITQAFTPAVDFFNGDGSTVAFTLSKPVASVAQVQAVISNVPQNPGSAFTVSGNTITFTSAPPSGTQNIYVYYTSPITQVIAPGQNTVTTTALQDGSVTTAKIADANVTPAKLSTGAPTWNSSGNIAGANATIGTTNLTLRAAANTYVGGALALQDAAGTGKTYITPVGDNLYIGNTSSTDCAVVNQYGVGVGPTVPQSGLGICFPATQNASSNANTLDDYEEGTWTPYLFFGGTQQPAGASYNIAKYVKIGSLVTVHGIVQVGTKSGATGNVQVGNLPFTAQTQASWYGGNAAGPANGFTIPSGYLWVEIGTGYSKIQLGYSTNGGSSVALSDTAVANGAYLEFSVSYMAA